MDYSTVTLKTQQILKPMKTATICNKISVTVCNQNEIKVVDNQS